MNKHKRGLGGWGNRSLLQHPQDGRTLASILFTASSKGLALEQAIQLLAEAQLESVFAIFLWLDPCLEEAIITVSA